MYEIFLIIEHCNGEIMSDPFIIIGINNISKYTKGEYLIYLITFPEYKVIPVEIKE